MHVPNPEEPTVGRRRVRRAVLVFRRTPPVNESGLFRTARPVHENNPGDRLTSPYYIFFFVEINNDDISIQYVRCVHSEKIGTDVVRYASCTLFNSFRPSKTHVDSFDCHAPMTGRIVLNTRIIVVPVGIGRL